MGAECVSGAPVTSVFSTSLKLMQAQIKTLPFQHSWTGHVENPTESQMHWFSVGCRSRCVESSLFSLLLYFIPFFLPLAPSCYRLQCRSWLFNSLFFISSFITCMFSDITYYSFGWFFFEVTFPRVSVFMVDRLMETCKCSFQGGANFSFIGCLHFWYEFFFCSIAHGLFWTLVKPLLSKCQGAYGMWCSFCSFKKKKKVSLGKTTFFY